MSPHVIRSRMRCFLVVMIGLVAVPLGGLTVLGQDPIDFDRARRIRERFLKGEKLSEAESAYLEAAKRAFQKKQGPGNQGPPTGGRDSIGLIPLGDMGADARYKGRDGGLYGGGKNKPPESQVVHLSSKALAIHPLDAEGNPSPNGKIGFISIGMSNTTQEFRGFVAEASRDPGTSRRLAIVDGAQGGMDASAWANSKRFEQMGRPNPWTLLERRLEDAEISPAQVQVAWIKQARANPAALGAYPKHADQLRDDLETIVIEARRRFPNLKVAYLSSRIYAGLAGTSLNPEPFAYESAFAVRDLILDQIKGKPSLNPDASKGKVGAPVLLWGPYLWADGVKGRKIDELVWKREDFAPDGTHPSTTGQRKVAEALSRFFKTDPTAAPWFNESGKPR